MSAALRILHLDDDHGSLALVRETLERAGHAVVSASDRASFLAALAQDPDVVLSDHEVPGYPGTLALGDARAKGDAPFVFVCSLAERARVLSAMAAGVDDFVTKDQVFRLPVVVARVASARRRARAEQVLVEAVVELSRARSVAAVAEVVRTAARRLAGADGATFVLREGDRCHYFDEDAIGPLWKGLRFPSSACISGWAMEHGAAAVVPDIYGDPRIPADAYRATFVKSLVMMPVRRPDPLAAIGVYWARSHHAEPSEVALLQALADSTAVAMENVGVYGELEERVRMRTAALEQANADLEAFSYAASHDLREPLGQIRGFAELVLDGPIDDASARLLGLVVRATDDMFRLVDDLLRLGQTGRQALQLEQVDLTALAMESAPRSGDVSLCIEPGLEVVGDKGLLRVLLQNLLANACKFSSKQPEPRVDVGGLPGDEGGRTFYVRDNGVGFDPTQAVRLFEPFVRLHARAEFHGTGVGLATCRRIVGRHGGRIWAESSRGAGATFYFHLPKPPSAST